MEMDKELALMKKLTETKGPSGFEARIHEVMKEEIKKHTTHTETDDLGGIVGKIGHSGPEILMAGHLDEVGLIVSKITDKGFLRFKTLGGWWGHVMLAQRVKVLTRSGDITGVIGSKAPHVLTIDERKNVLKPDEMFIDVGASSKEEAQSFGIRVGDPVATICPFEMMANPKYLLARNWDNRAGCYIALKALAALKEHDHPNVIYAGATVQEEVGLRGAQTLAHKLNPDIAFAMDVGVSGDIPGMQNPEGYTALGKGPLVGYFDSTMITHLKLRDYVVETAEKNRIPYQPEIMKGGGTDAGKFHLSHEGVPSIVISVPSRYIHSHVSVIHRDDLDNAVKLLVEVVKGLDDSTVKNIKEQNGQLHL